MPDSKVLLACVAASIVLFITGFFVSRYQCRRGNYDDMRSWAGWGLIIGVVYIVGHWLMGKHEIDKLLIAVGVVWAAVLGLYLGTWTVRKTDEESKGSSSDDVPS